MISKEEIIKLFKALNEKLSERGEMGEVGLVGGAVMCLVFDARKSTRDVDAIFKPATLIRELSNKVATEHDVAKDWLNDAAKGYIQGNFTKVDVLNLSHLRVWAPEPRYMLAMKCMSARWDTLDRQDVIFLLQLLQLKKKEDVFALIETYYPRHLIPPKTQFFIEEILTAPPARRRRK